MHDQPTRYRGAGIASALAGPLFLGAFTLATLSMSVQPSIIGLADIGPLLAIALSSILIGGIISIVPNMLGTAVMLWIGDHLDDANLPIVWALVGGLSAGGVARLLVSWDSPFPLAFALTGAASGLICRRFAEHS